MRAAFIEQLTELARVDKRIVLLTGDLGFSVLEDFKAEFPNRFFNVGVAEQNMAGIATGLAMEGYLPFTYSIATFATMRGYEFLRNAVLQEAPIRVIAVGGGFEYGSAGPTHHSLEDFALMRPLPGIEVFSPADSNQCRVILKKSWAHEKACFYRLGKNDRLVLPQLTEEWQWGGFDVLANQGNVAVISTGPVTVEAIEAVKILSAQGVAVKLAVVSHITNKVNRSQWLNFLENTRKVFTIEEHYVNGGLGSLTAETIAMEGLGCRLVRVGVDGIPTGPSGSQGYYRDRFGLSATKIVETVLGGA